MATHPDARERAKAPGTILHAHSFRSWYRLGKPYVKVWPAIGAMLGHSGVDIDAKFLRFPSTAS